MKNSLGEVAAAALDTLQGARKLPAEQAAQRLRDFLEMLKTSGAESDRLSEASAALTALVASLEREGEADNDTWQQAVETMVSLANEAS